MSAMVNSSDNHFFEGAEKLLEVWFTRKDGNVKGCDLRKIPRADIDLLMKAVQCEILSVSRTAYMDAYVLSESSMFVSSSRFILKTCGTTTPLQCLPLLTAAVARHAGFDGVLDLYYSRKNYSRPELQRSPHRTFSEEARTLQAMFAEGRSYSMGDEKGADCWYLFAVSSQPEGASVPPPLPLPQPRYPAAPLPLPQPRYPAAPLPLPARLPAKAQRHLLAGTDSDQTLEVIMTELDQTKLACFYEATGLTARQATQASGIDRLVPGTLIDEHLFEGCGYSMNGLHASVPGGYVTIHVTPEPEFSYASFETNIPQASYKTLIQRVVDTFGAAKFMITFFSNTGQRFPLAPESGSPVPAFPGFDARDASTKQLPDYDITYALYNRSPS